MPEISRVSTNSFRMLFVPGIAAVRAFWRPFLLLQSAAFLLVLGYYTNHHIRIFCLYLSQIKQNGGLLFAAASASIAGAILPELAKLIVTGDTKLGRKRLDHVGFAMGAFALNGIISDLQYRGLGWLLGNNNQTTTVIKKVLVDQFITTPIYGVPYWVLIYSLRAHRYNLGRTIGDISPRWYVRRVLPLLIPAWGFWLPMVSLVYALPGALQFCLYLFALAAWSLLMVFVATRENQPVVI